MRMSSFVEFWSQVGDRGVDDGGGNHQPNSARLLELADEIVEGTGAGGAFGGKLLDGIRAAVVHDALVPGLLQAANHVGAHSSQTNHSELHRVKLLREET